MGDGVLAEFSSAVQAVECAADIQRRMDEHASKDNHLQLRIGINLGDIIAEGDDIFGDGVNIAT